jgi:hypothetical protein
MKGSEPSLQTRWADTGLLALRVGTGFSLFFLFGMPKVRDGFAYLRARQKGDTRDGRSVAKTASAA